MIGSCRKKIFFLTILVGIGSVSLLALADPFTYVLDVPRISSGQVIDDIYYYGNITIETFFTDPVAGQGKTASYTLNACAGGSCPSGNQCASGRGVRWSSARDITMTNSIEPEIRINTTTTNSQTNPDISASPGGVQFNVVWESDGQDGSGWGIYGQRFSRTGTPFGGEYQINDDTSGTQQNPAVAQFSDDFYVVVWNDRPFNISMKYFSSSGNTIDSEFDVTTTDHFVSDWITDIATFPDDSGFVIVWRGDDLNHDNQIYSRVYDAHGNAITGEYLVNSDTTYDKANPAVASFRDGTGFVVVWESEGQDGSGDGIYGRIFDQTGSAMGSEFLINTYTSGYQIDPTVATLASENFVVAWYDSDQSAIFFQIFDSNGIRVGDEFEFDEYVYDPDVAALNDGSGFLIAYKDYYGIKARLFDANGNQLTEGFRLDSSENSKYDPSIVSLPTGGLAAVWESYNQDGSSTGIYGRVYSSGNVTLQGPLQYFNHNNAELAIQFKLDGPSDWCSPVRHYRYANPNEGSGGTISYPDGYTRQSTAVIGVTLPASRNGYQSLQLYQKTAPLNNGTCGSFGAWSAVGSQTTLTTQETVSLSDATCYQFKWTVTNILNYSYDYTSPNTIKVDRQPPGINFTDEIIGGNLHVHLTIADPASGVASRTYKLNSGNAVSFTQAQENDLVLPLNDGANYIELFVTDQAGNSSSRQFFRTADLTAPAILIHSIREGETYGTDVPMVYSTTQPLTGMAMTFDDQTSAIPAVLANLENGAHILTLSGTALDGTVISTTVHFDVREDFFNLSLISPQNREYEDNMVTVQYLNSKPVNRVWLSLDGGPDSEEMTLTHLTDGGHDLTLYAESVNGETNSVSTHFTVNKIHPGLSITSPENGSVIPGRTVPILFESRDSVTYEVGGSSGSLVSGESIVLPEDGVYTLTLTATHSSGNFVRQNVTFEVDTTEPDVDIVSPYSTLYATNEIPIEYTSNTPLQGLEMTLDGNPVTALQNLEEGLHTFRLTARNRAGRAVNKTVDFTIQRLEIVSPADQQQVVVENYPPLFPLVYESSRGFNAITLALDQEAQQLVVALPGETTLFQTSPGWHDLTLRGRLNEFNLARHARFKIGIKNIAVGKDSIHYTWRDCSDELSCVAEVTLRVRNMGDLDIVDEPIFIKFDHLTPHGEYGSPTQTIEVGSLNKGESKTIRLDPLRASPGDRFFVTVDPDGRLVGERRNDNVHSVLFEGAGKIIDVAPLFPDSNVYLSGVSFFNSLHVSAVGAVETVKFIVPGELTFIDNQADNGWNSIVDMGLLSPSNNCVQIIAYGDRERIMDSRMHCFDVKRLDIPDSGHSFPWARFTGTDNEIAMSEINRGELAIVELNTIKETLRDRSMAIIPKIREEGAVTYTLFAKTNQVPLQQVDQGQQLGGTWTLPVSHGLFVTHLDPAVEKCEIMAATIIAQTPLEQYLSNKFQEYTDNILQTAAAGINEETAPFNTPLEEFLEDKVPGIFEMTPLFNSDSFLFGGIFNAGEIRPYLSPFGAYYAGVMDNSIQTPVVNVSTSEGTLESRFQHGQCSLSPVPFLPGVIILNTKDSRLLLEMDSRIEIDISGERSSVFGFGAVSFINLPILPFFGTARAEIHPQHVVIPVHTGFDQRFEIRQNIPSFYDPSFDVPPRAWMRMQKTHGPVTLAEGEALIHFLLYGYGRGVKVKWLMNIFGMSDTEAVFERDPVTGFPARDSEGFPIIDQDATENNTHSYSQFSNEFKIYQRNEHCFLWWCWWGDWWIDDTISECEEKGAWYETPAYAPPSGDRPESCPADGD